MAKVVGTENSGREEWREETGEGRESPFFAFGGAEG